MMGIRDLAGTATAVGVSLLAAAATVAVLAPVPGSARAAAVLCFGLIGPGAAIAGLLRVRTVAPWTLVTLTGSIAVGVVATELAAVVEWWQPRGLIVGLAALSAAAAIASSRRSPLEREATA
jgi:hypothetical protein